MSENIINEGSKEYSNPESLIANSYTFGEPIELIVEKLSRRIARLEAVICPDCPGPANGCCKD